MNETSPPSVVSDEFEYPAPLVIPPTEHPVSVKDIDADALLVLRRLHEAGFTAYLVGGGVRDLFLGKVPKDFDISTSAKPGEVKKVFRNSRIIGRRFRLVQVFFGANKIVEVATFRRRSEYEIAGDDVVLPSNNSFGNPAEDAFRRDLTINALFYEIENSTIIDYTGGVKDLQDRIVRIVGDPERRITRDPVRMMRVIRHAARAGFVVEPATWEAITLHKEELSLCPVSRIRDELFKDLKGGASSAWVKLACDSGLFYVIFPFYKKVLVEHEDAVKYVEEMSKQLAVLDRLVAAGQVLPDGLLMAMLLLPWAEADKDFASVTTQKESYLLSCVIRDNLGEMFSQLNIKRAMQDEIARSLATLPLLTKHDNGKSWPKWLQKKSYFKRGMHLFQVVQETEGGVLADLPFAAKEPTVLKKSTSSSTPRYHMPKGGGRGPAFALNTEGGVFGFRSSIHGVS